MKKINNRHFKDFPHARLYLEDLKEILNVFESNCGMTKLSTGEYEEVLPSEIDDLVKELDSRKFGDINIKAYNPYISLDIRSSGISAYISKDDPLQLGIISKIREIIEKRKRKHFGSRLADALSGLAALGFGVSLFLKKWELFGVLFALWVITLVPVVNYKLANKVIVLTASNAQEKSFVNRNKDEILVGIILALIGVLLEKYLG